MHIFLLAAISADGYIDQGTHVASTTWTSKEDKQFFTTRTKQAGVLVMGRTTFETIGRGLVERKIYVLSSSPKPAKYAEIPDTAVEYTSLSLRELVAQLEAAGTSEVAICGGSSVYTQALQEKLVETIYLTVEPIVFGDGIKPFKAALETTLHLQHVVHLSDQTILLEYRVRK